MEEGADVGVVQRGGEPGQVVVARGQHMGLLVVQVLDAVLDPAQEFVRLRERGGRGLRHQACLAQTLQRVQRGPCAQFRELAAAHHLQQLHRELDFSDAAA